MVGKAKSENVLEHLFGEVVIYPIYLLFLEELPDKFVYFFRRLQIHTKWFLHDNMRPAVPFFKNARAPQARARQVSHYRLVVFGCYRKIEQFVCATIPLLIKFCKSTLERFIALSVCKFAFLELKK